MLRVICFSFLGVLCSGCGGSAVPKTSGTAPESTEIAVGASAIESNVSTVAAGEQQTAIDGSILLKGADLIVSLNELGTKDRFTLAEQFGRKVVQTTGIIKDFNFDSPTTTIVTFKVGPKLMDQAECKVLEATAWARLAPGQTVTLHGKTVRGRIITEEFAWQAVQVGPNPCPLLTIQKVVQDLEQNAAAATVQFAKQSFYLTGEFEGLEDGQFSTKYVRLKKEGQWTVKLGLIYGSDELVNTLTAGKKLSALCKYDGVAAGIDEANHIIQFEGLPIVQTFPLPGVNYLTDFPSTENATAELIRQVRETPAEYHNEDSGFCKDFSPKLVPEYAGKLLEITGKLKDFGYSVKGCQLQLKGPEGFSDIECYLLETAPWENYVPGQSIVVKGKVPEFPLLPALANAVIVKAEPLEKPLREMSAADLLESTKAAKAVGTSFDNDWKGQYVRISGTLIKSGLSSNFASIELQGDDDTEVTIDLASGEHAKLLNFDKSKAGDKVKVLAKIDYLNNGTLSLSEGWVLSNKPSQP